MAIDRNQAKPPVLPKETVESAPIGGEIIIRGLMWSDRRAMYGAAQARAGETPEAAKARADAFAVPQMLALTVLASDEQPLWTVDQWNEFSAKNADEVLRLFQIANRLSGGDTEAIAKN